MDTVVSPVKQIQQRVVLRPWLTARAAAAGAHLLLHVPPPPTSVDMGSDDTNVVVPSSSTALAFRLFKIAHKYEMPGILRWCTRVVGSPESRIPFRSGPSSVLELRPPHRLPRG